MADMPKFREFSAVEKAAVNDCFTSYLFYERINREGDRSFTCSHCGETFVVPAFCRTVTDETYELQWAEHNDYYHCPKCKIPAYVKNKGKSKNCQNLYEVQRVCVIQTSGENKVYIRCFEAEKNYTGGIYNPQIGYNEECRYYLTPQRQERYKNNWYFGWGKYETHAEPFVRRNAMGYPCDNSYTVIGLNRLSKTFLKYNMLGDYVKRRTDWLLNACRDLTKADVKMMRYLTYFAKYPQMEMLQKLGHYDVVERLVEAGIKSFPFVNWKAKSIYEFFKMSKQEYKEFIAAGGTLRELEAKRQVRQIVPNPSWATVGKYVKAIGGDYELSRTIETLKEKGLPIKQGVDYLIKQAEKEDTRFYNIRTEFNDYYKMAAELNYDIVNPVVYFPKDLKAAHDNASRNHNAWLREKAKTEEKKASAEYRKLKKVYQKQYEFSDGTFCIVIPSGIADIIREGKLQRHCVGGYAHRHVAGKLTICFLRRCDDIEAPLYTIEMHGKLLTQVQGKRNRTPLTPEASEFFDMWLNWVKEGSRRRKDGTPILPKEKTIKTA